MQRLVLVPLLVLLSIGCAGSATDRGQSDGAPTPELLAEPPLFDLTRDLTEEQLRTNRAVYPLLAPDQHLAENSHDGTARRILDDPLLDPAEGLRQLSRSGGARALAAGARGLVELAQKKLAEGDFESAASLSIDVYLCSAPHRVRLEALRVYCSSAEPERAEHWLDLIHAGRQDPWFLPGEPEFRAAVLARRK